MRWAHAAALCAVLIILAGCATDQDPVALLRAEVRNNPDSVQARVQLGNTYLENEGYHDAFIQFSAASKLDESSFDAALGLATAQYQLNNLEAASEQVKRALAIEPGEPEALTLQGKLMLRSGRTDEAARRFVEALEADPANEEAHRYLPLAYIRGDQPADAEEAARVAVAQMPESIDAHINLATALLARGQGAEAEATLRKAMELDPGDPTPPLRLAELLVQEGENFGEVIELAERATELDPGEGEAEAIIALALRKQGLHEEAVSRLHAAAMAHPRNVRLWLMLAAIYRDLGEDEAAARAASMAFRFAARRRVQSAGDGAVAPEPPAANPSNSATVD